MGKTSKKSATKVDSAVVPTKPLPKGKREAEILSKKDVVKKQKVEEKKVLKKKVESSSESEDDSESEELPKTKLPTKNGKVESDSEDDSGVEEESSSDEEPTPAKKAPAVKAAVKKKDSSDEESEEESSSDEEKAPVAAKVAAAKKKDESSEESDSEDESESDDEDAAKPAAPVTKATTKKKAESEDEDESSDDEEASDEEETPAKPQKKNDTDVKMTDAEKTPKTPSAPSAQGGSKTLFVGNMSFSAEQADVENFFNVAGEVVDVRFAMKDDSFRGFGHVEFATAEAALKALNDLNGKDLCGRPVRLDLAKEKGAYTPGGDETQSYQKGGRSNGEAKTVFVKGFDKYKGEDEIRNALQEHFASCGEMIRCSIPSDRETGEVKGMAYIDFSDSAAFNKALELDGSEFGDRSLTVNEATPRDNSGGGRGFGGRSGGRSSGGRFGRGDRDSGRGRGRGRGGRDSGRGRGGRDSGRGYNKPNSTFGGKKTTFD